MNYSLLAYLFICFSICLVCLGVVVSVVHHTRSPVARAFLAFYAFLTVSILADLLLSFLDVLPGSVAPETQTVLEYLEAMVGFYGMMFALPLFVHRVFAVPEGRRDRILLAIVGVAFVAQHVTEYGFGGRWDARGDFSTNTVKTHLRAVFDKSGCRSRFALMSAFASVRVPTGNPAENAIH